jgi:hypothetical protein
MQMQLIGATDTIACNASLGLPKTPFLEFLGGDFNSFEGCLSEQYGEGEGDSEGFCSCKQEIEHFEKLPGFDEIKAKVRKKILKTESEALVKAFRGQVLSMLNTSVYLESLLWKGAVKERDLYKAPSCALGIVYKSLDNFKNKSSGCDQRQLNKNLKVFLGKEALENDSNDHLLKKITEKFQNISNPILLNKKSGNECIPYQGYVYATHPSPISNPVNSFVEGGNEAYLVPSSVRYNEKNTWFKAVASQADYGVLDSLELWQHHVGRSKDPLIALVQSDPELSKKFLAKIKHSMDNEDIEDDIIVTITKASLNTNNLEKMFSVHNDQCESVIDDRVIKRLFCEPSPKLSGTAFQEIASASALEDMGKSAAPYVLSVNRDILTK